MAPAEIGHDDERHDERLVIFHVCYSHKAEKVFVLDLPLSYNFTEYLLRVTDKSHLSWHSRWRLSSPNELLFAINCQKISLVPRSVYRYTCRDR